MTTHIFPCVTPCSETTGVITVAAVSMYRKGTKTLLSRVTFTDCAGRYAGGGVHAAFFNSISIESCTFVRCAGQFGGGLHVTANNHQSTVLNSTFIGCTAGVGGGLYVGLSNAHVSVELSNFVNCTATEHGGGAKFETDNNYALLADTEFTGCSATVHGGALFFARSTGTRMQRLEFVNSTAGRNGGAVYLGDKNDGVEVSDSLFNRNYAGKSGGAIYSSASTSSLIIAGCALERNVAGGSGGALAVEGGNSNLVITDSASAAPSIVLESAHPYQSVGEFVMLFEKQIDDPTASAFMLHFDPRTELGTSESVTIDMWAGTKQITHEYHKGSALPGVRAPSLRVLPSFRVKMYSSRPIGIPAVLLSDNIYGFKLYATPISHSTHTETVFSDNQAGDRGGAVYIHAAVDFATILNARFERNSAEAGGAVYLRNAMLGFSMQSCDFTENESHGDGGALMVSSAASGMMLTDCHFYGNRAQWNGGAVALGTDNGIDGPFEERNELTLEKCVFSGNGAELGGAIHADKRNRVVVNNSIVRDNTAYVSGGGLFVSQQNVVLLRNTSFLSNMATERGGGIFGLLRNIFALRDNTVSANVAGSVGGGIFFANDTQADIYGAVLFSNNGAVNAGGAIGSVFSPLWKLHDTATVTCTENFASRGSALYFRGIVHKPTGGRDLSGHRFEGNIATAGGTVYWMHDSNMREHPFAPSGPITTLFGNNTAPYGAHFATQAVQILGPQKYTATVYGAALTPPLSFALYDFYGQPVIHDGSTSVAVSIVDADAKQCDNRFPFLTGAGAEEYVRNGVAGFDGLVVQCAPRGSITLSFEARLTDLLEIADGSLSSYYISNRTEMTFRSCRAGEFIKDGQCTTCPIGTFSLESTVTEDTECQDGTNEDGLKICYADQIIVKPGYWRRYPTSVSVLQCTNDLSGCNGGNTTGDSLCIEGHEGALCAGCAEGYFREGQFCSSCAEKEKMRPVTAFYLAIAAFVVCVIAFFFYSNCLDPTIDDEVANRSPASGNGAGDDGAAGCEDGRLSYAGSHVTTEYKPSLYDTVRVWIQKEFHTLKTKAKIIITTYQILSSIPTTTAVKFPEGFNKFLNAFSVFNLDIVSTVPLECTRSYTFIDKLMFTTLSPIMLAILLFLFFVCEIIVQVGSPFHINGDKRRKKRLMALKDKYLTYFFFLTYLVLPSVSTTIFQTFLCTNVDPSGEDSDTSDYYLTADMHISCTSTYYYRGVAYAVAMLLLYVVGIPLMYLGMLYYNREELIRRDDMPKTFEVTTQTDPEGDIQELSAQELEKLSHKSSEKAKHPVPRAMSAQASRLSFLWDAYEPKFWYWEVVETTRRLMLTAVLSVCGAGTGAQSVFAILLALMYIKLYGFYKPYIEDKDDFLAETGQFQIFFSFMGALIYQKSLLGPGWNLYVSIVLIVINLAVSMIFTYYEVEGLREQIREYREEQAQEADEAAGGAGDFAHHLSDKTQDLDYAAVYDARGFDQINASGSFDDDADAGVELFRVERQGTGTADAGTQSASGTATPSRPILSVEQPSSYETVTTAALALLTDDDVNIDVDGICVTVEDFYR